MTVAVRYHQYPKQPAAIFTFRVPVKSESVLFQNSESHKKERKA